MDALRLLSRGAKRSHTSRTAPTAEALPSGQDPKPQLFANTPANPLKRKRLHVTQEADAAARAHASLKDAHGRSHGSRLVVDNVLATPRSEAERKELLKQHKIKIHLLSDRSTKQKKRSEARQAKLRRMQLYPDPLVAFSGLDKTTDLPPWLTRNLIDAGYRDATEVQMATIPLQLEDSPDVLYDEASGLPDLSRADLLTVAPTGSGKTLAFLLPSIARLSILKSIEVQRWGTIRAIILAPTKELVDQIVNDGRRLLLGSGLKIAQYRKGERFSSLSSLDANMENSKSVSKADIVVSTPGLLAHTIASNNDSIVGLGSVEMLVLDEADVLLDPLFREQTIGVWHALRSSDLRVSLWSATMGSNIEELAQQIIRERLQAILTDAGQDLQQQPMIRVVVGLKDSAVPNVEHKLIYAATEQGKLTGLRQLLHPAAASIESAPALRPPFIIFTQTIERAVALHAELKYDIPVEAGGISRIAVLHSDLSDSARESVMTRFRAGEVWVLITTDLLSRGIDFRGVNGVVNYDIPTSSAAYVHRVGRTGRAGREGGVAVTLYSKEDIPYLKHVANVVAAAQREKGEEECGVQQWLLDMLPKLSKNDKQKLKKRGVEARTARGMKKDAKSARRAQISTKSGYDKREENNRRQAINASKLRAAQVQQSSSDDNFDGFD